MSGLASPAITERVMVSTESPSPIVSLWVDKSNKYRWAYKERIMRKYLTGLVFDRATELRSQHLFMWYETLLNEPKLRGSGGWIFESYAHDMLSSGRNFRAVRLSGSGASDSHGVLKFSVSLP